MDIRVVPILPVHDLAVAEEFYAGFGLEVERYSDSYAWVRMAGCELWHLDVRPELEIAGNATSVYVFVDRLDELHAGLVAAAADPSPLRDEPWGMREFSVTDPSGNRLRVGQPSSHAHAHGDSDS